MKRIIIALVPLLCLLGATSANAQEAGIFTRSVKNKQSGVIKQETPRGIQFVPNGKKELLIPAEDIVDVEYALASVDLQVNKMRPALNKEAEANKAKEGKRAALLAEAIKKFQEVDAVLTAKDTPAKRHMEYKVAVLTTRIAEEDGTEPSRLAAIAKLTEFKKRHPQSWQVGATLKTLAQFQMGLRQYAEAEATYRELAGAPVSDGLKQFAQLQALQVSMEAGRVARAEGKEAEARKRFSEAAEQLKALAEALPKTEKLQQQRAYLALAEMLAELDNTAEAQKYAETVLKDTTDKQVKAAAYNALGYSLFRSKKLQEARWQFLWVDVIYNEDKAEHAKSLYYLADIFAKLGEGERARECLDQLLTDQGFAGVEYQRRAAHEENERNKKKE